MNDKMAPGGTPRKNMCWMLVSNIRQVPAYDSAKATRHQDKVASPIAS